MIQGVHPAGSGDAGAGDGKSSGTHDSSFYREDIEATVLELKVKGVEFTGGVEDHGFGLVTFFKMPGELTVQLYQPRYVKNFPS